MTVPEKPKSTGIHQKTFRRVLLFDIEHYWLSHYATYNGLCAMYTLYWLKNYNNSDNDNNNRFIVTRHSRQDG